MNIPKNLFLFLTLFLLNSGFSAESLFLEKGEVVIDEDFSGEKTNGQIWRPAGQKLEDGFFPYDCSKGKDLSLIHI